MKKREEKKKKTEKKSKISKHSILLCWQKLYRAEQMVKIVSSWNGLYHSSLRSGSNQSDLLAVWTEGKHQSQHSPPSVTESTQNTRWL